MTTLTLADTIELHEAIERTNDYAVNYSLQDDKATSNITASIRKKDLLQYLKDDGLDVCPINYLADNYRQVIKDYLQNGFEIAERRIG